MSRDPPSYINPKLVIPEREEPSYSDPTDNEDLDELNGWPSLKRWRKFVQITTSQNILYVWAGTTIANTAAMISSVFLTGFSANTNFYLLPEHLYAFSATTLGAAVLLPIVKLLQKD